MSSARPRTLLRPNPALVGNFEGSNRAVRNDRRRMMRTIARNFPDCPHDERVRIANREVVRNRIPGLFTHQCLTCKTYVHAAGEA